MNNRRIAMKLLAACLTELWVSAGDFTPALGAPTGVAACDSMIAKVDACVARIPEAKRGDMGREWESSKQDLIELSKDHEFVAGYMCWLIEAIVTWNSPQDGCYSQ
jgi:hypothetical protein